MQPSLRNFVLKSSDSEAVTSYYQIQNKTRITVLRNRIFAGPLDIESLSLFSNKNKYLKHMVMKFKLMNGVKIFEGKFLGNLFLLRLTIRGITWWESYQNVPRKIVPFVPYGMSEIQWFFSTLSLPKGKQIILPLLHTGNGNEFSFEKFMCILETLKEKSFKKTIRLSNYFQGTLGAQMEYEDLIFDSKEKKICESSSPTRGVFTIHELSSLPPSDIFSLPEKSPFSFNPHLSIPPIIFKTKPPLLLQIRGKGSLKNLGIILFDFFRIKGKVDGTQFLRQNFHSYWNKKKKISTLTFHELFANSMVGPPPKRQTGKSQLDFKDIEKAVLQIWNFFLKKDPKARKSILVWKENAFLATAILAKLSKPPRLILLNPFWGTLSEFLQTLKIEDVSLVIQNAPTQSLRELCQNYPGEILGIGPKDEKAPMFSNLSYFEASLEEAEAPTFRPPGPKMWNDQIRDRMENWIVKKI